MPNPEIPNLRLNDDESIQLRMQRIKNGWLVRGVRGSPVFYETVDEAMDALRKAITNIEKLILQKRKSRAIKEGRNIGE